MSSPQTVYLAGPIAGCDKNEANDWRKDMRKKLGQLGIAGISPLRCEPLIGKTYELSYNADPKFGTARAISSKNLLDTRKCDLVLVYLPREINERRPSYGSIIELAWAFALNKPTILVTDDPYLIAHPLVSACSSWLLEDLDQAVDVIEGLLVDYQGLLPTGQWS